MIRVVTHFSHFQVSQLQQEFQPRIQKQMMDNFPYDLLRKSIKKSGDKKSKSGANVVDGVNVNAEVVVVQINLSLILLYLDLLEGDVTQEFAARVIGYLKGYYSTITFKNCPKRGLK